MLKRGEVPKGIKLITLSTSVHWFGWGLSELFIPVFILLFSTNLLEAGLLASVFEVFFLLSIPLAGFLSDRIKIKKILLASLIIYIFIGLGYFLAGLTTAVVFLIISRALNGISYSLNEVARETYIMRHSPKRRVSRIFGYFDFVTNLWWIIAVLIGLVLINHLPLHWLFFAIVPATIISFLMITKLKEKPKKEIKNFSMKSAYLKMFNEIRNFNKGLKLIAMFSFFLGVLDSVIYFFVPISTYLDGGSITSSAILLLAYSVPSLLGKFLGKIADKSREKIYTMSVILFIAVLLGLIYLDSYIALLIILFAASAIFELISLVNVGLIARLSNRAHLGEVDGSLNGIATIGAIVGPLLFGFLSDSLTIDKAYFAIIILSLIMLGVIIKGKKYLKTKIK